MQTPECKRLGKWTFGCKWETIYDTKEPTEALENQIETAWTLPAWLANLGIRETKYVGSICLTCGKYINREGEASDPPDE